MSKKLILTFVLLFSFIGNVCASSGPNPSRSYLNIESYDGSTYYDYLIKNNDTEFK